MVDLGDPFAVDGVTAIREVGSEGLRLLRLVDELEIDKGREEDKSCDGEGQPEKSSSRFHFTSSII